MPGMLEQSLGLSHDALDKMPHGRLVELRDQFKNVPSIYNALAPYEHQAFAREWTKEQPALAIPSLSVGIPLQYVAKTVGLMPKMSDAPQSPPSLDQVVQGYRGIGQGVSGLFSKFLR